MCTPSWRGTMAVYRFLASALFLFTAVQIVRSRDVYQPSYCCRLSMVAALVAISTITSQGSFIYPIALAIIPWHLRSHVRLPTAPTMCYTLFVQEHNILYFVCARVRLPGRFARNRKQRAPTGRKSIDRRATTSDTDRRERLIQLVAIQLTQTELGGLGGTVD